MNADALAFLAGKGLSLEEIVEFARLSERKVDRTNAERQARYRATRKPKNDSVTRYSNSVTLPPNDIYSNPLSNSSIEELGAAAPEPAKSIKVSCPSGVSQQVWGDFCQHRKAGKAAVSATAMAGIEREAGKAGWTLEAALSEMVSRGWRGFKAEWVKDQAKPTAAAANDFASDPLMRSIRAKQRELSG